MLLASKISRPDSPAAIIDRPRLYRQLDGWRSYRGVLVQAPTGYGKSTLVSRWIDSAGLADNAAWLSLAEEDNEPRRFVQYVTAALDRCLPGVAEQLLPALQDRRSSPQRGLTRLLRVLEETYLPPDEPDGPHVLLVLDDLQRAQSPAVGSLIVTLLEFASPRLHLLLLTRHPTHFPLARLFAQRKILALDKQDLGFTEAEVADYLQRHGFAALPAADVARVTEWSEGWVAALQLAVLAVERPGSAQELRRVLGGEQQWLAQYLVDEVLARQPVEVRDFLLQTALLERFNADLCAAVTGLEAAGAQIDRLARADLFLIALDRERGWFRYHHLFQEMLQRRLARERGPAQVAALHRRAGRWFAAQRELETALRHLLAGGAEDEAADLVEKHARRLIVRDHFGALRLFEFLPEHLRRERPRLALDRAFLAVVLDEPRLEVYVDEVGAALDARGEPGGEGGAWQGERLVLQSAVHVRQGDLQAAVEGISQAFAAGAVLDDLAAGLLWYMDFAIRYLRAEQTGYLASAERAIRHFKRADFQLGAIAVQRNLPRWSMERGESGKANQLFRSILDDLPAGRPETVKEVALCLLFAAENRYWQDDLAGALAHVQELRALADQLPDPALIRCAQVMSILYAGNDAAAEAPAPQNFDELEEASASGEFLRAIIFETRCLVAAGRAAQAWQAAQKLGIDLAGAADAYDHPFAILFPFLLAYIARGEELQAATTLLEGAVAHYAATGRRFLELQILVLLAWQQLKVDGEAASRRALAEADRLAQETGYARALLVIPELREPLDRLRRTARTTADELSAREAEVLCLLAKQYTYREIGAALSISINTVRAHVRQIYGKLGVHGRRAAIAAARRQGLLT